MRPKWKMLHPNATIDHLGFLPSFLDEDEPLPAAEQIDSNFQHGGGWKPFDGFIFNPDDNSLKYPGDPPLRPCAETRLRGEHILLYHPGSWIVIVQPDGSWEAAKVD